MNVREALREGTRLLQAAGSEEAALEAELLLRHALRLDRVHLYQRLEEPVKPRQLAAYHRLLGRRENGEPTPYILRQKEFFGLEFEVTPAAIIPRPETELLVELAIAFATERFGSEPFTFADIGVGCGAIAVSIAHSLPSARVIAIDVSARALRLAEKNAERHGASARISFRQGNLLAPLTDPVDVIAANLPYVRTDDWRHQPREIREHEPRGGLDGGQDGLRFIRPLIEAAPECLKPGGALFAEVGDDHGPAVADLAARAFPDAHVQVSPDLAGFDRILAVYAGMEQ